MRQLLLAALGAAGSLLMELPALAQLSNTTSTFSGQIAASCPFDLPETISLTYDSDNNGIRRFTFFDLLTNASEVRIAIGRVITNIEPPQTGSSIEAEVTIDSMFEGNFKLVRATKATESSLSFPTYTVGPTRFGITFEVKTAGWTNDGKYELPPGAYSYTTTIYCLQ